MSEANEVIGSRC